jgi:hypothetical protein
MDDRRITRDISRSVLGLHRPIPRYNSRHVVGSSTMRRGIPRTRPRDRATHPSIHVQVCRWTIARSSGTFLDQSPYSIDRSLDVNCGIPRHNLRDPVRSSKIRREVPWSVPAIGAGRPSIRLRIGRWMIARSPATFLDRSPYSIDRSPDMTCGVPWDRVSCDRSSSRSCSGRWRPPP